MRVIFSAVLILFALDVIALDQDTTGLSGSEDEFQSETALNAQISEEDIDFESLLSGDDNRSLQILPDPVEIPPWYFGWFKTLSVSEPTTTVAMKLPLRTPKALLGAFFAQNFCPMTKQGLKKLRKMRDKKEPFIPQDVANGIKSLINMEGTLFASSNLSNVIHRMIVVDENTTRKVPLENAVTYGTINLLSLIDTGVEHLVFHLDCSGFFSAAVKAGILIFSTDTAAKLRFDKTMFVLGGKIQSPIGMAISPGNYKVQLPDLEKFGVLAALAVKTLKDSDNATVSVPMWFYVVASSAITGGSLQGALNVKVSGSIAIISGSAESDIQYKRNVTSNDFDTLLLPAPQGEEARTITVGVKDIRSDVRNLFDRARVGAKTNIIDGDTVISMSVPQLICSQEWTLAKRKDDGSLEQGKFGIVSAAYVDEKCNFTLQTTDEGQVAYTAKLLTIHNSDLDLQNTLEPT